MTAPKAMEKLKSISVKGLFRRFDHTLSFGEEDDLVIVTAPNGYGKTAMLRIIDAIFKKKYFLLRKMAFESIEVSFYSGKSIQIFRDGEGLFPEIDSEKQFKTSKVTITTKGFGGDQQTFNIQNRPASNDIRALERILPLERIGPNVWLDYSTDRHLNAEEIIELYSDRLPGQFSNSQKIPEWLLTALDSIKTHLVETQRLLLLNAGEDGRGMGRSRMAMSSPVVEKNAQDLKQKIGRVLQRYANESQKLDQSFPKRVIDFRASHVGEEGEVRQRLQDLSEKREDLVSAGLFGAVASDHIQPTDILSEEQVRRILSIYIEDTEKKLSVFDDMYGRIRLFKQIINEHFAFKKIEIDADVGIKAIDTEQNSIIPLSELSSGEQHELVLIYELLFIVDDGSVILIDEPELSLHVAWQKRFISNIQKIQSLKSLEVIIATHSPQIINDRWDLVQELRANQDG